METFKSTYLNKCAELSIEPMNSVLNILVKQRQKQEENEKQGKQISSLSEKLDLSGHSISIKSCSALASALAQDTFFTRLVLADAFLGDDGKLPRCSLKIQLFNYRMHFAFRSAQNK